MKEWDQGHQVRLLLWSTPPQPRCNRPSHVTRAQIKTPTITFNSQAGGHIVLIPDGQRQPLNIVPNHPFKDYFMRVVTSTAFKMPFELFFEKSFEVLKTPVDPRSREARHWKANTASLKYEAPLCHNLGADLVEKMKSDRTDVRVVLQIKAAWGTDSGSRLLRLSTPWPSWSWSLDAAHFSNTCRIFTHLLITRRWNTLKITFDSIWKGLTAALKAPQ